MTARAESWAIVVPVKRLTVAKTRIDLAPDVRMALALAMAADTIRAATGSPMVEVVVAVCDDQSALDVLREAGAIVVPDVPDAGLNPALVHGSSVDAVAADMAVAALAADLPALHSDELTALLRVAGDHKAAMVADAAGAGTTVFAATDRDGFRPSFGTDSRSRHLTAGATDLTGVAGTTLRRDVDTLADLSEANALGLGPATTRLLADLAWGGASDGTKL